MPIYINEDVLSLPEQVQKNKEDIATNAEAIAEIDPSAITAVVAQVGTNTTNIATNANDITNLQNGLGATNLLVTNINGRLTTAEGNITNLTTRIGTAEGNITSEVNTRNSLIGFDSAGNTRVRSTTGKTINMESDTAVSGGTTDSNIVVLNTGITLMTDINDNNHQLVFNATGDLKLEGNTIADSNGLLMGSIVDANGDKRFVNFNGTISNFASALTNTYCKASLSGTHLMFVLAGVLPANADIDAYGILATYTLPDYIFNKIIDVSGDFIEFKECVLRNVNNYSDTKTFNAFLRLWGDNTIAIGKALTAPSIITNVDRGFRIQFDLLID